MPDFEASFSSTFGVMGQRFFANLGYTVGSIRTIAKALARPVTIGRIIPQKLRLLDPSGVDLMENIDFCAW
ncbi:MAG TPA: hypothetical protein VNO43_12010, partial [Candidatus Eisenbacteria bacterium]|nr:hypothetical protein [Candidatus Eisenbacteria bacterium]